MFMADDKSGKNEANTEYLEPCLYCLGIIVLSKSYMNKDDDAYINYDKITHIEGFEDLLCHGTEDKLYHESNIGVGTYYTAKEFADIIRSDKELNGKNIRLLSCNTGASITGFAQQLANELGVDILAPTETLWINEDGKLFVSNSRTLAEMWNNGLNVFETGKWVLFKPEKGEG